MFRYSVYCTEYGFPLNDPYDEDQTFNTAIEVCKSMAITTKCRWYVYDNRQFKQVYVYLGDKLVK